MHTGKTISIHVIHKFLKKNYFLILGIVFIVLFCFYVFVYYKYVYSIINIQIETDIEEVSINQDMLKEVLDNLEMRQENLLRVETIQYPDPFK
ncbi:MAG: hypothetical protein ABIC36_03040 [bacterium]